MKKLLVLLLIVSFVGVAVFAQDAAAAPAPKLTWSGRVQTGIKLNGGTGTPATTLQVKDSKDSSNPLDAQFNVGFGDGVTWGLNAGINFSNATTASSIGLADTNAWYAPIPQLKLTVGKSGFGAYGTFIEGWDEPDITGLQIGVFPIDGLSIGLFLPISTTAFDAGNSIKNLAFGAKLALPKAITITAEYFLDAHYDAAVKGTVLGDVSSPDTGIPGSDATSYSPGQLDASIGLTAVDNLTAAVDFVYQVFAYTAVIEEKVGYNFGVVSPDVIVKETLVSNPNSSTKNSTTLKVVPELSFALVPNVFNPYIGVPLTFTIPNSGDTTTQWQINFHNDFTIGNGVIRVGFDVGAGDGANGAVGTTAGTSKDLGWDINLSYNLTWSN
jgi:hypothetical protein